MVNVFTDMVCNLLTPAQEDEAEKLMVEGFAKNFIGKRKTFERIEDEAN